MSPVIVVASGESAIYSAEHTVEFNIAGYNYGAAGRMLHVLYDIVKVAINSLIKK